jgi:ubiquitin-conjugating enzyme E2 S
LDPNSLPLKLTHIILSHQAEIEGPEQTPYHTRYFQLKLVLSTDFPNTPPRGYFLTKIYHPNVDPTTGAICVNTLKKDWTPTTSLSHVLMVIRCLLIVPFPESSLNDEAGKNFMESYEEFARRATTISLVHGLKGWSTPGADCGEGKSEEDIMEEEDGKQPAAAASCSTLPNAASDVKLGKNGSRSNIVKSGSGAASSKSLDKKMSKKKSLKRL